MAKMENILTNKHKQPNIDCNAYVNPYATIIGDVTIHAGASVLPGVIIRASDEHVEIGPNTAILDKSIIEALRGHPVYIGEEVLISHGVTINGSIVDSGVLIGSHANIQEGARIGEESVIAAGALISPNTSIPPRSKVVGVPAKVTGEVTEAELEKKRKKLAEIMDKAREYGNWFVAKHV